MISGILITLLPELGICSWRERLHPLAYASAVEDGHQEPQAIQPCPVLWPERFLPPFEGPSPSGVECKLLHYRKAA
jgi:hypothetical protein